LNEILAKLGRIGLIPVVKLDSPEQALPLGKALLAGHLPVAEITFRTDAAEEAIKILSKELPELITGAGTVTTVEQVDKAAAAGARYIVTPGLNPKVVAYCQEKGLPVTPGVNSPSQIEQALEMGLKVAKFFPAGVSGGVPMLRALAGPYGDRISFIPTGGVNTANLVDYLSCGNVFAVGGSWMVPGDAIRNRDFIKVETLCKEARMLSLGFSLLHIGVNPDGGEDPFKVGRLMSELFGMQFKEGNNSAFVGVSFEMMKKNGRGRHGHIAIETISVERALEWFAEFGIKPVADTIHMNDSNISSVYLDWDIMGFAVHLNRK